MASALSEGGAASLNHSGCDSGLPEGLGAKSKALGSALRAWSWVCSRLISVPYSWKEDSVGQNETSPCWRPGGKILESDCL